MVPETAVISTGGLKGFVTVSPSWGGMTARIYEEFCRSAYSEDELKEVEHEAAVISGKEHAMGLTQLQLSEKLGITDNFLAKIEGGSKNPSIKLPFCCLFKKELPKF